MKTDQLIDALGLDLRPLPPLRRLVLLAALGGVALSVPAFLLALGIRPDAAAALENWRFPFKFLVTMLLALGAAWCLLQAARPETAGLPRWPLLLAPALLLAAMLVDLAGMPQQLWLSRMIGANARICLTAIPALALAPLALLLLALRRGAPASPTRAGALAGLLSAALAATLYAAHCTDDSPLFVALWYSLAAAFVTALGAFLGRRLLAW